MQRFLRARRPSPSPSWRSSPLRPPPRRTSSARPNDNSLGVQTDVVTGAGHPGYPGDSALFEDNHIYSNNFNTYDPASDVKPAFPFPVGTGLWIAGGNHHRVRDNLF